MNGHAWLLLLLLDALGSSSTPAHAAGESASPGHQVQSMAPTVIPGRSDGRPIPHQETGCRQELECWGARFAPRAQQSCAKGFDEAALWDARWWSLWDGEPLTHVRWRSQAKGVLEYYLDYDQTRLQCVFDPAVPKEVEVMYFPRDGDNGVKLQVLDTGKAVLSAGH